MSHKVGLQYTCVRVYIYTQRQSRWCRVFVHGRWCRNWCWFGRLTSSLVPRASVSARPWIMGIALARLDLISSTRTSRMAQNRDTGVCLVSFTTTPQNAWSQSLLHRLGLATLAKERRNNSIPFCTVWPIEIDPIPEMVWRACLSIVEHITGVKQ